MLVSLGGKGMRWYRGPRAPYQNGQETEENIEKAFSYEDILRNEYNNKISAILTIEDGGVLEGSLDNLKEVYEKGVRLITLTWNYKNGIGHPNFIYKSDNKGNYLEEPDLTIPNKKDGLTTFGIELIKNMEDLGIIIDVSHLSDKGFYDVLNNTRKPFVASHSNSRSITNVVRNMDDEMIKKQVVFYTKNVLEDSSPALKPGHFFGREVELFELREMLAQGGRYLISGIGGSGKTELVRQFLKICVDESLVDGIAVLTYQEEMELDSAVMSKGKKTLLIVDGMDEEISDQLRNTLYQIPATIIATSRRDEIKGFDVYRLRPIGKDAASLIFRDNYDGYLDEAERQVLDEILENESWCHPLTLRLLAKYVKKNGYTIQDLKQQLNEE